MEINAFLTSRHSRFFVSDVTNCFNARWIATVLARRFCRIERVIVVCIQEMQNNQWNYEGKRVVLVCFPTASPGSPMLCINFLVKATFIKKHFRKKKNLNLYGLEDRLARMSAIYQSALRRSVRQVTYFRNPRHRLFSPHGKFQISVRCRTDRN